MLVLECDSISNNGVILERYFPYKSDVTLKVLYSLIGYALYTFFFSITCNPYKGPDWSIKGENRHSINISVFAFKLEINSWL